MEPCWCLISAAFRGPCVGIIFGGWICGSVMRSWNNYIPKQQQQKNLLPWNCVLGKHLRDKFLFYVILICDQTEGIWSFGGMWLKHTQMWQRSWVYPRVIDAAQGFVHSCSNQQFCFMSHSTFSQGKETIDPSKNCSCCLTALFEWFQVGPGRGRWIIQLFLLLAELPVAVVLWKSLECSAESRPCWNFTPGHCSKIFWKFLPPPLRVGGINGVQEKGMTEMWGGKKF